MPHPATNFYNNHAAWSNFQHISGNTYNNISYAKLSDKCVHYVDHFYIKNASVRVAKISATNNSILLLVVPNFKSAIATYTLR